MNENARLKNLLEVGLLKCQKGNDSLREILSKQSMNSKKEGLGFTPNFNSDGTKWRPEQYPKTKWILGRGKNIELTHYNGYARNDSSSMHANLDANYRMAETQNGKVYAKYVGNKGRNVVPCKTLWVRKDLIASLRPNVFDTSNNASTTNIYGPKKVWVPKKN